MNDARPPDPELGFRAPRGPLLLVLLLLAGLGLAEWWLPAPPRGWQRPLLEDLGHGRVRARPGDDPTRYVELTREPERPRILWLGASTVLGVPYDPELSPPRWLSLVLEHQGVDAEVVTLASPGATSAEVLHWLPGALELDPDAVVITSGHNEWLHAETWLADDWTTRSDLAAWLARAVGHTPPRAADRPTAERPFDHGRVAAAFRETLLRWEALCADAGVPLVVTMPESNLADCPPVLDLEDGAVDAFWERGRRRLGVGDHGAALGQLRAARDRDGWPHRAVGLIQDVVKSDATRPVNTRKLFADASATGIPGADLFIDHCHPNPTGQRLLALAVAERLVEAGVIARPPTAPAPPTLEAGEKALGLDKDVLHRARARAVRAWLRLALMRSEPGPLAQAVRARVDAGWLGPSDHLNRALLAVLESDRAALTEHLAQLGPGDRHALQLLYDEHPWVVEGLLRLEAVLVDGELVSLGA